MIDKFGLKSQLFRSNKPALAKKMVFRAGEIWQNLAGGKEAFMVYYQ
jgi:hypothetical protein